MRALLIAVFALASPAPALAQRATEQFIPIGQSPGAITMQGEVTAAAEPASASAPGSITMTSSAAASVAYEIAPSTRIYVDRSAQRQPNTVGTMADLQPGRAIEVAVAAPDQRVALWIKVRAPAE